jgi:hypothetical protein
MFQIGLRKMDTKKEIGRKRTEDFLGRLVHTVNPNRILPIRKPACLSSRPGVNDVMKTKIYLALKYSYYGERRSCLVIRVLKVGVTLQQHSQGNTQAMNATTHRASSCALSCPWTESCRMMTRNLSSRRLLRRCKECCRAWRDLGDRRRRGVAAGARTHQGHP